MNKMIKVRLDGEKMNTRERAHNYMRCKLNLTEYYGRNLDALWDMLSIYSEPIEIHLLNYYSLIDELGAYGDELIEVFRDAERENKNIKFIVVD